MCSKSQGFYGPQDGPTTIREKRILECVNRLTQSNEFHARVVCMDEDPEEYRTAMVRDNKQELGRHVVSQIPLDTRSGHNAEDETTYHIDSIFAFNHRQLVLLVANVLDELGGGNEDEYKTF